MIMVVVVTLSLKMFGSLIPIMCHNDYHTYIYMLIVYETYIVGRGGCFEQHIGFNLRTLDFIIHNCVLACQQPIGITLRDPIFLEL